jgi:hypothetical protein
MEFKTLYKLILKAMNKAGQCQRIRMFGLDWIPKKNKLYHNDILKEAQSQINRVRKTC